MVQLTGLIVGFQFLLFGYVYAAKADYICTDSESIIRQCHQRFILDLSRDFTSEMAFQTLQNFLFAASKQCFDVNVAREVFVTQAYNQTSDCSCCSTGTCSHTFSTLKYSNWTDTYSSNQVVNMDGDENRHFAIRLVTILKIFDDSQCPSNNVVLLSNRVFGALNPYIENIRDVLDYSHTTLSIIITGRGGAMNLAMLKSFYSGITDNLFVVPDVGCTKWLSSCIFPCGNGHQPICTNENQLSQCGGGIGVGGNGG